MTSIQPITLAALDKGDEDYIAIRQIPRLDLYFSFTGGPTLDRLAGDFRCAAAGARVIFAQLTKQGGARWRPTHAGDLGYLGTYSPDRQPALDRLLLQPACRLPRMRFVVAGPQYPAGIDWPGNVERLEHVAPADHAAFYAAQRFTLNITRAAMIAAGWSPSVPSVRGCFMRNADHQRPLGLGLPTCCPSARRYWSRTKPMMSCRALASIADTARGGNRAVCARANRPWRTTTGTGPRTTVCCTTSPREHQATG